MTSILTDTKASLGLADADTTFDAEIIMHINSVLADLYQLGIGPTGGLAIADNTTDWSALLVAPDAITVADESLNMVRSYLHLRVKLLFDPPQLGYLLQPLKEQIEKAEWRITVAADPAVPTIEEDVTILSGGFPDDV